MKLREDLRTWFKQSADSTPGWDRYDTKGNIAGKCGDSKEGAPYAACLSPAKAGKLGKSGVASFVRRKREAQRKAGRGKKGHGKGGKPIMVDTGVRKLSEEYTIDPKNGLIESMDLLLEKNKPTSPDKWQDCISQAKAKFDIFPSAYSNGWAVQCYKRKGGKWKSVNEDKMVFSEFLDKDSILRQIKEGKTKKVNKKKSRDWKDEQFLKGLESGKKISELLGGRKMTTADGKPVRMGRKVMEAVDKESMPCNKPRASTRPGKKKMVKACEGGQEKIIHYGAKGYGHNYSPAARKSFRARHSCSEKKTKLGAQHWACKDLWAGKGGSTKSCPEGRKCKY